MDCRPKKNEKHCYGPSLCHYGLVTSPTQVRLVLVSLDGDVKNIVIGMNVEVWKERNLLSMANPYVRALTGNGSGLIPTKSVK